MKVLRLHMVGTGDPFVERVYCQECHHGVIVANAMGVGEVANFCPACGSGEVEISFPQSTPCSEHFFIDEADMQTGKTRRFCCMCGMEER